VTRSRVITWAAIAVLVLGIGVAGVTWWQGRGGCADSPACAQLLERVP
jgi:hypothetical protein